MFLDHNIKRITKADYYFTKNLDIEDIKFLVKVREIHKNKKTDIHWHSCFWL